MRRGLVLLVLVATGSCEPGGARPTCAAGTDCKVVGWACVESEPSLTIPPFGSDTRYDCVAQGILEEGATCIFDSECVGYFFCSGLYQMGSPEGSCHVVECETRDDCGSGQGCRFSLCVDTTGQTCDADTDCAPHQVCAYLHGERACDDAPAEGGNECQSERECAVGRDCIEGRCQTCVTAADCTRDFPDAPSCLEGHCRRCGADSECESGFCNTFFGCVECREQTDCPDGTACADQMCRQRCSGHEACPSGYCVSGVCSEPVGTPCPVRVIQEIGFSAAGIACGTDQVRLVLEECYCTRPCGEGGLPACPDGYQCSGGGCTRL